MLVKRETIAKIGPRDGRARGAFPFAVERRLDFPEVEGCPENVGSAASNRRRASIDAGGGVSQLS